MHVIERGAPETVHGERHLTRPDEADAYLAEVQARAFQVGNRVEHHVHDGATRDVARSIVEHGLELKCNLIVMCTHGRGGLRDLLFGSIAQKVAARGATPVLLVYPTARPRRPSPVAASSCPSTAVLTTSAGFRRQRSSRRGWEPSWTF